MTDSARSAGKSLRADPGLGHDQRHLAARRVERRRDLGADEASADHDERRALPGQRAQAAVVGELAEVDDVVAGVARKPPRAAAGREQKPFVAVGLALVVGRPAGSQVERDDAPPEVQIDAELGGPAPDRALVLPLPEPLRERRTAVGRVGLLADEADRAVGVVIANPAARRVGGHAAADDQIPVVGHDPMLIDSQLRGDPSSTLYSFARVADNLFVQISMREKLGPVLLIGFAVAFAPGGRRARVRHTTVSIPADVHFYAVGMTALGAAAASVALTADRGAAVATRARW